MPFRVTPADAPGEELDAGAAPTAEEAAAGSSARTVVGTVVGTGSTTDTSTDPAADPAVDRIADLGPVRRWLNAPRPHLVREIVLMGSLYATYSLIRNLAPTRHDAAQENARAILDAERTIGLDIEKALNHIVSDTPWLAYPAIYYYATLHLLATFAVIVWLYRCRPLQYAQARGVLLVMTLIALAGYYLYPLAPPRLMEGGGYIDTSVRYELWGYTPSEAVTSISNQYAAMPSMHFGWALWVGVVLALLARTRLVRMLGVLYPIVTLVVIVVTGNHFVLDAVAALLIFLVAPFILTGLVAATRAVRHRVLGPPAATA